MSSTFHEAFLQRIGSSNDKHKFLQLNRDEIIVGRSKQSHYIIEDLLLSRKHATFRLIDESQWTVESVGQNGVILNYTLLPKNQQIPIQDMDIVEIGNASKYVYAFRLPSALQSEEPPAIKKMRLAVLNCDPLNDLSEPLENVANDEKYVNENSVKNEIYENFENANVMLRTRFLEDKLTEGFRMKEFDEKQISNYFKKYQAKMKGTEEMIANVNLEKQILDEEREFIVQQLMNGIDTVQERYIEETLLRKKIENELWETRRKAEEEKKQLQQKCCEEKARCRLMRDELIDCEAELNKKESLISEIQSRSAVGLELYTALKVLRETGNEIELSIGWIVDVEIGEEASNAH